MHSIENYNSNGDVLPFDRSTSLRHLPGSANSKRHQPLPRSSSTRARSLTDPLLPPQQLLKQYNTGLLLIDNKDLVANNEELKEALAKTQEIVKREEAAHCMALSEVEKRYDDLKKALEFEKHCQADLLKALREIGEENKQINLKSQTNLADAKNIVDGIEDKARQVEDKMQQADAKLAEAERKSLDLDQRLQDLETHESMLQKCVNLDELEVSHIVLVHGGGFGTFSI